jgi:hypothetical protein
MVKLGKQTNYAHYGVSLCWKFDHDSFFIFVILISFHFHLDFELTQTFKILYGFSCFES